MYIAHIQWNKVLSHNIFVLHTHCNVWLLNTEYWMLIFCLHVDAGVQEGKWQKVERRITDR